MSHNVSELGSRDYFDKARSVSAAGMIAAGTAAVIGSFLDWVTIEPPKVVPADQADRLDTFTGVETGDGWVIVGAAGILLACTFLMVVRKRSGWAWGAFLASMVIGGIAVADYRDLTEKSSRIFYDEMERIGDPAAGLGITLVAAAGVIGLIASAAGVAASPRRED